MADESQLKVSNLRLCVVSVCLGQGKMFLFEGDL